MKYTPLINNACTGLTLIFFLETLILTLLNAHNNHYYKLNFMKKILFILTVIVVFSSCGPQLRPFTDRMHYSAGFTESELKRIQFYVSRDIVLQKRVDGSRAKIDGGKIRVIGGERFEEIVIRRNTPGVFAFNADDGNIAISFEGRPNTHFLIFGPSRKRGGEYVLRAAEWNRDFGIVNYNGEQYSTPASSAFANLMVDVRGRNTSSTRRRTASGARVRG